jgi:exosortase/archaeosortase family protein
MVADALGVARPLLDTHSAEDRVSNRLIRAETLLAIELLAFWPVWRWYVHRMNDQSDEAWGIVALVTAALFVFLRRPEGDPDDDGSKQAMEEQQPRIFTDAADQRGLPMTIRRVRLNPWFLPPQSRTRLMAPATLLLCYSALYHFLSPLPRAAIAVTAIAATVSAMRFGRRLHLGVWGLLLLALPVVASLQFYLGFPMRAVVARLAAPMLQTNGFAVTAVGASLNWNGDPILIDAPCSGIKMLWTGFYLTCALACYYKLDARRTALACVAAFAAIIIGNTFRAAALFYVESGAANLRLPDWTHEGVGVVVFAATAIAIAWMAMKINQTKKCRREK